MKKFFTLLNILRPLLDVEKLGDYLLDCVEDYIQRTDNKTDDTLVLPAVKALRIALDIPDEDKPNLELVEQ